MLRTTFATLIFSALVTAACSSGEPLAGTDGQGGLPPLEEDEGLPPATGEGEGEGEDEGEGEGEGEGEDEGDTGLTISECFSDIASPTGVAPAYEQFDSIVGSHCQGTNHQNIQGIERVVFLGDSVTVGTPPSLPAEIYRSLLADRLAARFGLTPPSTAWKSVNPFSGQGTLQDSGDFAVCAKWGARNDDLNQGPHFQIDTCIPASERHKKTLVIMTSGGNDIADLTKDGVEGKPLPELEADVEYAIAALREAVLYMKDTTVFTGGIDLVFTNNFEFTDGTGDVGSCPAAGVGGFAEPWEDPTQLARFVVHMMEQYLAIARESNSDLVFVLESFCGHGYNYDDPQNTCYRGPDAERWFDLSCTHPNPTGHAVLADMFMNVIEE